VYLLSSREFDWKLFPETDRFLENRLEEFLTRNETARKLSDRMSSETSTRFFNWVDHLQLPKTQYDQSLLESIGFMKDANAESQEEIEIFRHEGGGFFPILLVEDEGTCVALKPERIDHFIQMLGTSTEIEGTLFGPLRKATVSSQSGSNLIAVERRGFDGFDVQESDESGPDYAAVLEGFTTRSRLFSDDSEGLVETAEEIGQVLKESGLSKARVADAFFRAERRYWQNRSHAGQAQKARQDILGLGWGNHDHHTYRSSRRNFSKLVGIMESLGFSRRERFFAGVTAGWGAQVFEHPVCQFVLFTDIDISDDERDLDSSRTKLDALDRFGTVGLWVAIHGESILTAGLHHLAALVDFYQARDNLKAGCVESLKPFSEFEFLRQSFTVTQRWSVQKSRADRILQDGRITNEKHSAFLESGAIGGHLELIERRQGFKGFNQESVTAIIKETDPRAQA
jgi:hypothetical protein